MGDARARRAARARRGRPRGRAGGGGAAPAGVAVLGGHRQHRARDDRGRGGGAHRIRDHGHGARGADGRGDVLCAVHARLVPRPDAEGAARGARRDDDPRIHAPPARRGRVRPQPRHHDRRLPGRARAAALPRLPRSGRAPAEAGRGRDAGRREGPRRGPRRREPRIHRQLDAVRGRRVRRRPGASRRRDPGDRQARDRALGAPPRLCRRAPARRRRLRPRGCGARAGLRWRPRSRSRREGASRSRRARDRADDRPGSRVRDPDHGRHRREGALAGGQRPDDRRAGAQPPRRHVARPRRGGPARPARVRRPRRQRPPRRPGAPLGGVPRAGGDRDPRIRRRFDPGGAPAPCGARGPRRHRPRKHRPAVEAELVRLEATVAATFGDTVDLDRAGIADPQGIGGSSRVIPAG